LPVLAFTPGAGAGVGPRVLDTLKEKKKKSSRPPNPGLTKKRSGTSISHGRKYIEIGTLSV